MKKFSKVEQAFVGTTDASSTSFNEKPQSSTTAGLSWLLIEIVTWGGDFRQVGTFGVRAYPGL